MNEDTRHKVHTEREERGAVQDVVVPIAAAGVAGAVGGAVNAYVGNKLKKDTPAPPKE